MNGSKPSADLRSRVLAAVRAEPVHAREAGLRRSTLFLVAGFAASVAVLFRIGGPGARGRPSGYFIGLALLWLGLGLVASWTSVARGRSMLGRPAIARMLVATLTPVALVLTAAVASFAWPAVGERAASTADDVICIVFTVVFALGPLAAFALVRRSSDPVAPRLTGAAIGAAAGVWGALGIELRCHHESVEHVVLGHVFPVVLLTFLGVIVGDRIIALRAKV